jgi:hypothetical protein
MSTLRVRAPEEPFHLLDPRRPRELAERRREVWAIGLHDPGLAVGQVGRPERESLAAGLERLMLL